MEVCQDCKPACNTVTPEPSTIQYSISLLSQEDLSQGFLNFFDDNGPCRKWPMLADASLWVKVAAIAYRLKKAADVRPFSY